jgi:two-component system, NtrC family, response regulator PilR
MLNATPHDPHDSPESPLATLPTVLVVDDETDLCTLYQTALQRAGYAVLTAQTLAGGIAALTEHPQIRCVVSDFRLPDGTGLALAQHVAAHHALIPISIITAYGSPEHAVEALKVGAFDYLQKPVSIVDLRGVVERMVAQHALQAVKPVKGDATSVLDKASFDSQLQRMAQRLPGQSPLMKAVHLQLMQLSRTQACVVFLGETGTGKELAARAVHAHSLRAAQPFTVVDCSALDKPSMDAALFGSLHPDGTKHIGLFQAAQGGTVLLDEVSALPLGTQLRLLKLLQERSLRALGAAQDEAVDVRIMVSSRQSLPQLVAAGLFRQDLYYRLNVMVVQLPALRERQGDAAWLAQRWLAAHPTGKTLSVSAAAADWLNEQVFEGNVRELENLLERATALCAALGQDAVGVAQLQPTGQSVSQAAYALHAAPQAIHGSQALHGFAAASAASSSSGASSTLSSAKLNALATQHTAPTAAGAALVQLPLDLTAHLAAVERDIIEQALQHGRYNRAQAALLLGLNQRQLRYRIEQLGIEL